MLTDTQKASVRLYLGYPDYFRYQHTRLESVLNNLSPEAETLVSDGLTNLAAIEVGIANGAGSASTSAAMSAAGIKRVDEVWFFSPAEANSSGGSLAFKNLKAAGRYYVTRISIITGVPIYSDVFGTAGYLGDTFSGLGGGGNRRNGGWYGLG